MTDRELSAEEWGPAVVAAVAEADPDRPAVVVAGQVLTYAELDQRSRLLGAALRRVAEPGDRILLRYDSLAELAVALLAAARTALVTVLVDPTDPDDRVRRVAGLVDAVALLTDVAVPEDLGVTVVVPLAAPLPAAEPDGATPPLRSSLASISFTSGTTGEPKGIMLPVEERFSIERVLALLGEQMSGRRALGMPFMGSTAGIDSPLHSMFLLGTSVHGFDVRTQGLHEIEAWLLDTEVEAFAAVPTAFRFLLTLIDPARVFPHLRLLVSSGEPLDGELVVALRRHLTAEARIFNVFGLTEARTVAGLGVGADEPVGPGPVPAGRALEGVEVTIVDEHGDPVPDGTVGEIVVSSTSCGLGYWGLPDLSAEVFTALPDGRRRVRTGDAGRLRPDGLLEQTGRLDHVVKVAGNRVDLAEVEQALRSLDEVALAVAVAVPDPSGELRLRAVVVLRSGATADPAALRRSLAATVSRWLVPDRLEVVGAVPTLASGKADRRRVAEDLATPQPVPVADAEPGELPDASDGEDGAGEDGTQGPQGPRDGAADARPVDLVGVVLAIWRTVLDHPDLGPDDDFFEAGGDSLRGAQAFAELAAHHGLDRPLSLLVRHPTARTLAAALPENHDLWSSLVPIHEAGNRPPLFVIHGGHGEVLFARGLSELLGPDQPVYGLRAEGLDGFPPAATSLEEVAAGYVEHLRSVRPHGPYALYGHSLGGAIALEMALLLEADGESVSWLALGDTAAPGAVSRPETLGERIRRHARSVRAVGPAHAGALARRQVKDLRRRLARGELHRVREVRDQRLRELTSGYPVPPHRRGDHVMLQYGLLAMEYRPSRPYTGPVVFLRAGLSVADRGWERWLPEGFDIVDVPGRHGLMGVQPGLGGVADGLAGRLGGDDRQR